MAFKPDKTKLDQQIPSAPKDMEYADSISPKIELERTMEKKTETPAQERWTKSVEDATNTKKRPNLLQKKSMAVPQVRDELTIKIEKILEQGLDESYQNLSPIAKQEFKIKGEQTAIKIRDLMRSTRVKVKKILKLILEWLRMLPGVNVFFLEQEAKIKADRIISLKDII
ncbi:MAG: hypothetical protein ABH832_04660 [bacterium]